MRAIQFPTNCDRTILVYLICIEMSNRRRSRYICRIRHTEQPHIRVQLCNSCATFRRYCSICNWLLQSQVRLQNHNDACYSWPAVKTVESYQAAGLEPACPYERCLREMEEGTVEMYICSPSMPHKKPKKEKIKDIKRDRKSTTLSGVLEGCGARHSPVTCPISQLQYKKITEFHVNCI